MDLDRFGWILGILVDSLRILGDSCDIPADPFKTK